MDNYKYKVTDSYVHCILNDDIIGVINMLKWYDYYEINNVFVREEYRGQGIAKTMMNEAIKYIKKKHYRVVGTCSYAKKYLEKEKL